MQNQKKEILIGISYFHAVQTHLWGFFDYFFRVDADKRGYKIISREANNLAEIQVKQLQEMLEQKIDLLLIAPQSSDDPDLVAKVKEFIALGIPVIALDSEIGDGDYTCVIGADNFNSQKAVAEYVFSKLNGKAKVAYLQGIPELKGARQRIKGFHAALANHPHIELVFEEPTFYGITLTIEVTTKCLQQHPDIDAIIAANDYSAFGAIHAIEKLGITKPILISGIDGHREVPYAIRQGRMTATVNYSPERLAELTINVVADVLAGKEVPKQALIDVILINAENLDEITTESLRPFPSFMHNITMANEQLKREVEERKQNHKALQAYAEELERRDERHKRDQAKLKAYAEELERRNQELQNFAYIASHDLREPLRKIQIFGNRLQEKYKDILDPRGFDYLTRMQKASHRMQTLIEDILTFSRLSTREVTYHQIDLNNIMQDVLDDLKVSIDESKVEIIQGYLPTLTANPTQMRQLFQNLLSNSLKFRQPNHPLVINIESSHPSNHVAQIKISDNGIGFEPEFEEQIFGMFQRLHANTVYEGTGIGLAICRRIIEQHQGTIAATGEKGKGATFTISLPTNLNR